MILSTLNILVIGYTIAHIIPVILTKRETSILEKADYDLWISSGGFVDDQKDLFHMVFKWMPPKNPPEEITEDEFTEYLSTEAGRKYLEAYRTSKGVGIGTYEELVKHPYEVWKKQQRVKYAAYYESCISGNNEMGKKLKTGQDVEEIYPIDTWREMRRLYGFEIIVAGSKPSGYGQKKKKDIPKSATQMIPVGIFAAVCLGVLSWWGIDLWVLATATGGLAVGVGFALQETMQNWFAYIMIRKDNIISEGERVSLESGYNGYVHKITSRVTYIRDGLNESFAIIPTRQLVSGQITSYSKEVAIVPAVVQVGVLITRCCFSAIRFVRWLKHKLLAIPAGTTSFEVTGNLSADSCLVGIIANFIETIAYVRDPRCDLVYISVVSTFQRDPFTFGYYVVLADHNVCKPVLHRLL